MQRFLARDAKFSYSPGHAPIGTVQPGERFEVESVEGFYNSFASASDFTPERYAEAEKLKWAVTGPIAVAGARGRRCRRGHDPLRRGDDARRRRLRRLHRRGSATSGGTTRAPAPSTPRRAASLRFDERTTLPTRPLIGCLAVAPAEGELHAKLQGRYGGNLDCREIRAGRDARPARRRTTAAGSTSATARRSWATARSSGPPEVGALVTASAEPRARPASMTWPRIETAESITTLVSGRPLEWSARQAYRELLEWVVEDYEIARPQAALLLAMVAHAGICQISNTDYTAYCVAPRDVLEPYRWQP